MNIRRKVTPPSLREYFRFEWKYFGLKNNLYYNTQIFNKFTFIVAICVLCGVLGLFKPLFWATGLSSLVLVAFLYFKTYRLGNGISITRLAPQYSREHKEIEVVYTITNETAFPFSGLSFLQEFDGIQTGSFKVELGRTVPAHTRIKIRRIIRLDAGMGIKTFAPVKLILRDELNLFDFGVQFFQTGEIEVYPHIEETPKLKSAISPESIDYGFYEVAKRGDSNLFIGTREYRHGDPVKHINWKLTKKTHQVVVNEYEKSTNTFITLMIDLELDHQLGAGEISTWDSAKDLALSIATNEIAHNNQIQVVANNLFIPFGCGRGHLTTMEKHFTFHEIVSSASTNHLRHLYDLPPQGQIYYICPLLPGPKAREAFEVLKRLKIMGQNVSILALDPFEELRREIKGEMKLGVMETERFARAEFEKIAKDFQNLGVHCLMVKVQRDKKLYDEIVQAGPNLLEVK